MANNIQFKKKDNNNGLNLKIFESSETIQLFDTIRQWLQKNCKKVCGYLYPEWCWFFFIINKQKY